MYVSRLVVVGTLHLEYQLLPELLGDLMLRHEEVHQALDHIGGGTLPGLRPGHHHHYPLSSARPKPLSHAASHSN